MFAFDANRHEYVDEERGEVLQHITGLLEAAGWIDSTWYTEQSCERGSAVHRMTADFDLGALDPVGCTSGYKPYLLGHVEAVGIIKPMFSHIEIPMVHPRYRYGGQPDRVGLMYGASAILEIKTAIKTDAHPIQTALQAILVAPELSLPPEAIVRYALYLKPNGRYKLEPHTKRSDFFEAQRIIKRFT